MELYGTVVEVQLSVDIPKTSGGTYEGWVLKYTEQSGEEKTLKAHSLSLKKIKGLKEALLSLSKGDAFSATIEKEGAYWVTKEIRKGGGPSLEQANKQTQGRSDNVQRLIVRQNCLGHACGIANVHVNTPDVDAVVSEVKRIAATLEEWVFRND
ncbi:MAG: hypothetical protein Q7R56_03210 [Nanoarchaeota archaeon]|nr:hypothetical protein [Nanoarchaeota archaeon]